MLRHTKTSPLFLGCLAGAVLLPMAFAANDPAIQPRGTADESTAEDNARSGVIQGFTEPYADISMAASEMGTLSSVRVREGDLVKAGQLLAGLDDAVLQASLQVAAAGMAAAGDLESATTQLDLKKVEQQKLKELFSRNHASQQELDRVQGEVRIAEARVQSAREDLEIRRLEHARIEAQLKQREIRSTIDGVVVEVRKDLGEFVSPSDPVVARIVQLDPLLVVFSVPTERRSTVTTDQPVAVRLAGSSDVRGIVEFVSPTADPSSGTFRVKVRLPNPQGALHGGEKAVLLLDQRPPTAEEPKQIAKRLR
ncbi:MAG: efflux RND transporter periplasmic adaptor subunit [Fuerstiella sp.]